MNKMMKHFLTAATLVLWAAVPVYAQEYAVEMGQGKLVFKNINGLELQGHTGNSVVFKREGDHHSESARSKGLRAINSLGLEDNSMIGLSVVKNGSTLEVQQVSNRQESDYVVMVPKGVSIQVMHDNHHGETFRARKISSEIEVSTKHSSIVLNEVTGPLTVSSVHGDVDVVFSSLNQGSPVSIISTHGHVDVSLPGSTKTNLRMSSQYGDVFTDMNIDIDSDVDPDEMRNISTTNITGKLNGGGVLMSLEARHGNIYLRTGK